MYLVRLPLTRSALATARGQPARAFSTSMRRFQEQSVPVLSSLQSDLKAALRAKDKARLTTLRVLMAEITNASKTDKPITTDASFFPLLQKQIKASKAAVEEFENAKRDDLVEKEQAQLKVLEDYVSRIDVVGQEEVDIAVKTAMEALGEGAKAGSVVGKVMAQLRGRPVQADLVKTRVQEILEGKA